MTHTTRTIEETIKEIKENSKEKFDATVEIHVNITDEAKKQAQSLRYTYVLPHGTGKEKKVAVLASKKVEGADLELTQDDIDKLASGKIKPKTDFDILVTEPKFMPKLAKAARVLGPAGVMPNPKNGTVTEDVEDAVSQVKKGKIEIRVEASAPVIHSVLGKVSFEIDALAENYNGFMSSLRQNKPQKAKPDWIKSVFVTSSMGKSHQIEI
jgi:large subunit ribosomal protein L1